MATQKKNPEGRGRRKVEMKKIEQCNRLQVTFSKRKSGLFKKAGQLCLLTGAQIAIIVSSPANRLFSFGDPSVDSVIHRYLTGEITSPDPSSSSAGDSNSQYSEMETELQREKRRRERIEEEICVEDLGVEELEKYLGALEELKSKVLSRANELKMIKGFFNDDDDDELLDTSSFLSEGQFGSGLEDLVMVNNGFDYFGGNGQI